MVGSSTGEAARRYPPAVIRPPLSARRYPPGKSVITGDRHPRRPDSMETPVDVVRERVRVCVLGAERLWSSLSSA